MEYPPTRILLPASCPPQRPPPLFVRWAGANRPVVWEEYSSGHPAEERTWEGLRGFTPVRYTGASRAASPSSSGKGAPVMVTWNSVPNSEASLDLILTGGRTISRRSET